VAWCAHFCKLCSTGAAENNFDTVILHAADSGRRLYESVKFAAASKCTCSPAKTSLWDSQSHMK
jgi:hypothetical protein